MEALLLRLTEGQRALVPSAEEQAARAEQEPRIVAALAAAPDLREIAEQLGRVTAERDQARAEAEALRAELSRPWWRRWWPGKV